MLDTHIQSYFYSHLVLASTLQFFHNKSRVGRTRLKREEKNVKKNEIKRRQLLHLLPRKIVFVIFFSLFLAPFFFLCSKSNAFKLFIMGLLFQSTLQNDAPLPPIAIFLSISRRIEIPNRRVVRRLGLTLCEYIVWWARKKNRDERKKWQKDIYIMNYWIT